MAGVNSTGIVSLVIRMSVVTGTAMRNFNHAQGQRGSNEFLVSCLEQQHDTRTPEMGKRAERLMDADEFLVWCLDQEDRYELVNGVPVKMTDGPQMMTGASRRHDVVVVNILSALRPQLRGSQCFPSTADIAVRTRIKMIRRPDVTVTCGPPSSDRYEADDPKMVVEVMSPSNKGVGWQRKLEEYRHLTGLKYILLVETETASATLLSRPQAEWVPSDYDTLADVIELPAIGCRLPMADIYEGVTLDEPGEA